MAHPAEILFIDPAVADVETILGNLRPEVQAIVLDRRWPAARQMAAALEGREELDAVHVIAHGTPGRVCFAGGDWSAETLERGGGFLRDRQGAWRKRRPAAVELRNGAGRNRRCLHRGAGQSRGRGCLRRNHAHWGRGAGWHVEPVRLRESARSPADRSRYSKLCGSPRDCSQCDRNAARPVPDNQLPTLYGL